MAYSMTQRLTTIGLGTRLSGFVQEAWLHSVCVCACVLVCPQLNRQGLLSVLAGLAMSLCLW